MIIQEPVRASILHALENYAYADAIFLSERLYAEVNNEENLYLLATAHFRAGKPNVACSLLSQNKYNPLESPNCQFLRAKCCFQLGRIEEAIRLLLEPLSMAGMPQDILSDKKYSLSDIKRVYGELSPFVAQILGQLFSKTHLKTAAYYYHVSLMLNPFLWSSYEKLLQISPSYVDHNKLFSMENYDPKYTCGTNTLMNIFNSSQCMNMISSNDLNNTSSTNNNNKTNNNKDKKSKTKTTNEDNSHYNTVTPEIRKTASTKAHQIQISTPYAIFKQAPGANKVDIITPETDGSWQTMNCLAPTKNISKKQFVSNNQQNKLSNILIETSNLDADRTVSVENTSRAFGVLSIDQEALNTNDIVKPKEPKTEQTTILTRRSSRLNPDRRGATPVKRCRRNLNYDKNSTLINQNNENSTVPSNIIDVNQAAREAQHFSANGLMELFKKMAIAYKRLAEYRCRDAIECFKKLPSNHYNTGFVLSSIGRCHFEMGAYEEAINFFKQCRQLEPYRLQGLEIYSTALWHLQRELELSCLSQELIQFDKLAPETWCVAGNCFSLQKDHEISIKFLKRAIQVDPSFSYAYTLLGHELISADELDNALSCFQNATRIDPRHYNGWCGIGLINYKQEKYDQSAYHYKRALEISPQNPILMCHLAIVYHHWKKSREAIAMLNEASVYDPQNVLIKYHRASIRFSLEEYQLALEELEELKKIVPKESMIYFLIGKIHKIRGETHLAVLNFSWAVHIDPKGSINQHKQVTEPNQASNDELTVHSTSHTDNSFELPSTPGTATPFTQRSAFIIGPINNSAVDTSMRNSANSRFSGGYIEYDDVDDVEVEIEEVSESDYGDVPLIQSSSDRSQSSVDEFGSGNGADNFFPME